MSKEIYVQIISDNKSSKTGLNINKQLDPYYYGYTITELHHFYGMYNYIKIIKVPDDTKITKLSAADVFNKYKNNDDKFDKSANIYTFDKFICCQTYPLYDIKTAIALNLKITPKYIRGMCHAFRDDVLNKADIWDELKNSGLEFKYDNYVLDYASQRGFINVLNWWKNSGLKLKYTEHALDSASAFGHIDVLNWWLDSGLPLKYSEKAMDFVSSLDNVNVLDWWKNSGLPLKYSENAIDNSYYKDHINVLEWWKNSGLPLKYTEKAMHNSGSIDVLEWWKNSGLPLKYFKNGSHLNRIFPVRNWWEYSGLPLN
jgi:hypothetical protein